jgi:tetratricopeptide (TPR) repeat protein
MPTVQELYNEADRLKDAGHLEEAIAKLEQLVSQQETYALAHSALAVLYGKVRKHEEAVRHALRVCELEPNDAFSFTALSVTYQRAFAGTNQVEYIRLAEEAMARAHMIGGR